jgi:hypothetical protein
MIPDPTCPSRTAKQESRLAAGAVEEPAWSRRRNHREPRSTSVQRTQRIVVDTPAVAPKDASVPTSRLCRSTYCRTGTPAVVIAVVARATGDIVLAFSFPLVFTLAFDTVIGVGGQEGEGLPEGAVVPAVVDAEAAAVEGGLHLRAWSRMRRPVPRPPSGPPRSPQV